MAGRKNKWRTVGRFQFRRETKRFSDGTPEGHDILWIRIPGKACVFVEPFDWKAAAPGKTLCINVGTFRAATPFEAAHLAKEYLLRKSVKESDNGTQGNPET